MVRQFESAPSRIVLESPERRPSFVRRNASHRGFSFTELLFAVMILGIGFIMIAAMFPVGLSQTKSNFDETIAATTARQAIAIIAKDARKEEFTSTTLVPLQTPGQNNTFTSQLAHYNMILPADPRYAWVGLYKKMTDQSAQVCVFVVNRSDPFEKNKDFTLDTGTSTCRMLEPRPTVVTLDTERVQFSTLVGSGPNTINFGAAAPGAFIVIQSPNLTAAQINVRDATNAVVPVIAEDLTAANTRLSGNVYRAGATPSPSGYEWYPGSGFQPETFTYTVPSTTVQRKVTVNSMNLAGAFIVGRNRVAANADGNDFDGGVMDVAFYTSFISLK